jgi:energy-coupling factor transporter ATP-binding protein EcfA2
MWHPDIGEKRYEVKRLTVNQGSQGTVDIAVNGNYAIGPRELDVNYGSFRAVKGVNLAMHPGKITAFIGPSGGGKKGIADKTIDVASSDSLLKTEEYDANPTLQMFPVLAGAVVPIFNIKEITGTICIKVQKYLERVHWSLTDPAAAKRAAELGYATLPDSMRGKVFDKLAQVTCDGKPLATPFSK